MPVAKVALTTVDVPGVSAVPVVSCVADGPAVNVTQQVLRNFFSSFCLIFQYVSPLDPWI